MKRKQKIFSLSLLTILAINAALGWSYSASAFQFVDRILRPCGGTSTGIVQVTTTNILLNPCPGGSVTINGVPITPTPGGGIGGSGTANKVAKFTAAQTIGNSNITDTGSAITATAGSSQLALTTSTSDLLAQSGANYSEIFSTAGSGISLTVGNVSGDYTGLQVLTSSSKLGDTLATKNGTVLIVDDFSQRITLTASEIRLGTKFTRYNNATALDGQVLIGGTAAGNWTAGTISGTSPIVVTNGNNTIGVSCPTCATGSTTPGGANTQLQFNDSGVFGGDSGFTYIKATDSATLAGELTLSKALRSGTASNTDLAGTLTIGAGGTITYTFTQTYASAPICVSNDTDAVPLISGASASTTTLTITGSVGHVVTYICVGRN